MFDFVFERMVSLRRCFTYGVTNITKNDDNSCLNQTLLAKLLVDLKMNF